MQADHIKPTFRTWHQGKRVKVAPERSETAAIIDNNGDRFLSNEEIAHYYVLPEKSTAGNSREKRLHENKFHLRGVANPVAEHYRSAGQVADELKGLEDTYPTMAKRHVIGTTHEGRPIYALQVTADVTNDTSERTGVVFTGLYHSREWMTTEVVADSASKFLKSAADGNPDDVRRMENGEFWFVPVVNPDGLEYSRDVDNTWRKNRRPIQVEVDGQFIADFGVDLNRNHGDGSETGSLIFRPAGDTPGSLKDDSEWGADNPGSYVYRGPSPASEAETEAIQKLTLERPNIRGVLDYHSFGESVIYPPGYFQGDVAEVALYRSIAEDINEAAGGKMEVKTSAGLYPINGGSVDFHHANGIVGILMEINDCFQPDPAEIKPTTERFHKANMIFADRILEGAHQEILPERVVFER